MQFTSSTKLHVFMAVLRIAYIVTYLYDTELYVILQVQRINGTQAGGSSSWCF